MFSNWLLTFTMAFSGQAILTFGLVKMLGLRHRVLIWAIAFLSCVVTGYFNAFAVETVPRAIWSFGSFVVMVWMYWAFATVKPVRRLVVISSSLAAALLSEFPLTALFMTQGFSIDEILSFAYERVGFFFLFMTTHAAILAVLLLLIYGFTERAFSDGREWGGMKAALFPAAQVCLVLVVAFAERDALKQAESFILITALSTLVVLAAYLLGFLAVRRWHGAELADMRIRNLRERSELAFQQTENLIDETERLAKIRHDFKNQLQVVEFLSEEGEREQALGRLERLESAVRQRTVGS